MINRLPYQLQGPVRAAYAPVMMSTNAVLGQLSRFQRMDANAVNGSDDESLYRRRRPQQSNQAQVQAQADSERCSRMMQMIMSMQGRLSEVLSMINQGGYQVVRPGSQPPSNGSGRPAVPASPNPVPNVPTGPGSSGSALPNQQQQQQQPQLPSQPQQGLPNDFGPPERPVVDSGKHSADTSTLQLVLVPKEWQPLADQTCRLIQ